MRLAEPLHPPRGKPTNDCTAGYGPDYPPGRFNSRFIMDTQAKSRLRRNADVYDSLTRLLKDLSGKVDGESLLIAVEAIAQFAANYHVGRFADGALENPAFDVGANLNVAAGRPAATARARDASSPEHRSPRRDWRHPVRRSRSHHSQLDFGRRSAPASARPHQRPHAVDNVGAGRRRQRRRGHPTARAPPPTRGNAARPGPRRRSGIPSSRPGGRSAHGGVCRGGIAPGGPGQSGRPHILAGKIGRRRWWRISASSGFRSRWNGGRRNITCPCRSRCATRSRRPRSGIRGSEPGRRLEFLHPS